MRDYELVVIVNPVVGDEGFPTTVDRITNFIKDRGAEIKNVDQWGRRRLAYPIRRNLDGYYAVTYFSAEPQMIRPIEANLDLAEDILRHLVVKLDDDYAPPPPRAPRVEAETAPESTATDGAQTAVAVAEPEALAAAAPEAEAVIAVAEPEAPVAEPAPEAAPTEATAPEADVVEAPEPEAAAVAAPEEN